MIQLLVLLPPDIIPLITKETEGKSVYYNHIKELISKRSKLSLEAFSRKFILHQSSQASTWRDLNIELTTYIEDCKIWYFSKLKELLIS